MVVYKKKDGVTKEGIKKRKQNGWHLQKDGGAGQVRDACVDFALVEQANGSTRGMGGGLEEGRG